MALPASEHSTDHKYYQLKFCHIQICVQLGYFTNVITFSIKSKRPGHRICGRAFELFYETVISSK